MGTKGERYLVLTHTMVTPLIFFIKLISFICFNFVHLFRFFGRSRKIQVVDFVGLAYTFLDNEFGNCFDNIIDLN